MTNYRIFLVGMYNFSICLKFLIIKGWGGRMSLPFDPEFLDPHPALGPENEHDLYKTFLP